MATRRESVVLDVTDNLTPALIKAAGAAALLKRELNSLDGAGSRTSSTQRNLERDVTKTSNAFEKSSSQIDRYGGRLGLIAEAAITLGPALVPLGAAAVGGVAGLTAGLVATGAALGVTLLAVHGLGDGLKALETYQLAPTTANLQAMRVEMEKLGPAGAEFVRFLDGLGPQLSALQMTARAGLFPGVEDGINSLLTRLPQVKAIIADISQTLGGIAADAGANLAGPKFDAFFAYIQHTAGPTLQDFARSAGNVGEALANMLVAFNPVSQSFSGGLLRMSRSFAEWSRSLDTNQGFQNFIAYVQKSGPQVLDFIGSLVSALAGIVEAAAPVGSVVLPILTQFLRVIGVIAKSDIGGPIIAATAAFVALNRVIGLTAPLLEKVGVTTAATTAETEAGAAAMNPYVLGLAALAGAAIYMTSSSSDLTDAIGRANMAMAAGEGPKKLKASLTDLNTEMAKNAVLTGNSWSDLGTQLTHPVAAVKASWDELFHHTSSEAASTAALIKGQLKLDKLMDPPKISSGTTLANLLVGPLGLVGKAFDNATMSAKAFSTQIQIAEGVLSKQAAFSDYQAAIDAMTASLQKNGKAHRFDGAAGRENNAALRDLASTALQFSTNLKGADKVDFLSKARGQIRQSAIDMGKSKKSANDFVDSLKVLDNTKAKPKATLDDNGLTSKVRRGAGLVMGLDHQKATPKATLDDGGLTSGVRKGTGLMMGLNHAKAEPKADLNYSNLVSAAAAARAVLASLDGKTATTYIRTVHTGGDQAAAAYKADGGYISGPGGPRDDVIPAWLSNGEFVVNAAATKANLGLLHSLNAKKFADGGPVSATTIGGGNRGPGGIKDIDAFVGGLSHLLTGIHDVNKKELDTRKKDLERASKQFDKAAQSREDQAKKEADAAKARLQAEVQARQALVQAISGRFADSPFSNVTGPMDLALPTIFGTSTGTGTAEEQIADYKLRQQYLATIGTRGILSPTMLQRLGSTDVSTEELRALSGYNVNALTTYAQQYRANVVAATPLSPLATVQQQIGDANRLLTLEKRLKREGLSGAAFSDAAQNGSLDQLTALAGSGPRAVQAYDQAFSLRNRAAQAAGAFAGDAVMGAAIGRLGAEAAKQTGELQGIRQDNRELKQEVTQIRRELDQRGKDLAKLAKQHSKDTGAAVVAGVNGAATAGIKGRVPR